MDTVRYAEASAYLVNATLRGAEDLRTLLVSRQWLVDQCTDRDVGALRRFQRELRAVYEAAGSGDTTATIERLNALLGRHPITPQISDHDPDDLHLHVAAHGATVSELLVSESLLGLANLVCDLGATRLGVCAAVPCTDVYVDTSPNRSRRYCSDRCSSRANVAAYRARRRAAAG